MTWRRYLQAKTRDVRFLVRMAATILAVGFGVGLVVDWAVPAWIKLDPAKFAAPAPEPEPSVGDDGWADVEALAERGAWGAVARSIPGLMLRSWRHPGATTLAALTGLCWLAFVLQAAQVRHGRDVRLWAPLAGLALGVVSIGPTLFLILWQEKRHGIVESAELAGGLRFYLAGVGLREELAKLVCFLPLVPFLARRRDDLAALLAAASVGLGFAMEENVGYIGGSGGTATLARLLTPAPFHMAVTGLTGYAFYRACRWPKEWLPAALATLGVAVLAHGLYDAFLSVTVLADYALAASVIFVLLVYQFFHELRPLLTPGHGAISLSATFVACVCVVAAATYAYLAAAVGWRVAANITAQSLLAQGVIIYLFLREMPERLVGG